MSNTVWSMLPNRRVVIGSLVGALLSGSLLGLVIGIVAPAGQDQTVSSATTPSPTSASAKPTRATPTSASPTKSTKTKPIRTTTLTAMPAPSDYVQQPWSDHAFSLGILQSMNHSDPNNMLMWVTRGKLLFGPQAAQYLQSQGRQPATIAVAPAADQPQTLTLAPDAVAWGQQVLGGGGLHRFNSVQDFLNAADNALNQNIHPAVWVKVDGDRVVYIAEQFPGT